MIRALLLSFLILGAPLFAASPEYLVGGTETVPAPGYRGDMALATDGTDFLAAWVDFRSPTQRALMAARVTRDGRVLEPFGIRIAATAGGMGPVGMAWDGEAYLVVWTVLLVPNGTDQPAVYAARLDRDGRIVLPPRVIAEEAFLTSGRSVATNGNVTVVSYSSRKHPYGAAIVALDRHANPLHHESLGIPDVWTESHAIAATPARFVLTWSRRNDFSPDTVHALALTSDGRIEGEPVLLGEGTLPRIATDGSRFLILGFEHVVKAWVVDADLEVIPGPTSIAPAQGLTAASVLWRNGRYEVDVATVGIAGVQGVTKELDASGKVIASRPRDRPTLLAATNGSEVLALFTADVAVSTHPQLFAALYRGSRGNADVQTLLSWSGNGHTSPVVAASPSGHLVAWIEESGVYFTRVDANGNSLDGRGVQLGQEGSATLRVAFDGTDYVAAWVEGHEIVLSRIAPATGAPFNEARFEARVWNGIALAASPDATYVVWAAERVYLQEIPHSRSMPPALPIPISPDDMLVAAPAASWNGSELLIVWNRLRLLPGTPPLWNASQTLGARVTGGLTLLDPAPLVLAEAGDDHSVELGPPAVASDGNGWLAVLGLHAYPGSDVLARRVLANGTIEGNAPVRIAAGSDPVIAWDGTRYAVAFKHGTNVLVAAVPATGALTATRGRLVATHTAPSVPSIAPAADGEAAVVYTRESFLPQHTGVERTFLRFMDHGNARGRVIRR